MPLNSAIRPCPRATAKEWVRQRSNSCRSYGSRAVLAYCSCKRFLRPLTEAVPSVVPAILANVSSNSGRRGVLCVLREFENRVLAGQCGLVVSGKRHVYLEIVGPWLRRSTALETGNETLLPISMAVLRRTPSKTVPSVRPTKSQSPASVRGGTFSPAAPAAAARRKESMALSSSCSSTGATHG